MRANDFCFSTWGNNFSRKAIYLDKKLHRRVTDLRLPMTSSVNNSFVLKTLHVRRYILAFGQLACRSLRSSMAWSNMACSFDVFSYYTGLISSCILNSRRISKDTDIFIRSIISNLRAYRYCSIFSGKCLLNIILTIRRNCR